jgi:hypothetical protein
MDALRERRADGTALAGTFYDKESRVDAAGAGNSSPGMCSKRARVLWSLGLLMTDAMRGALPHLMLLRSGVLVAEFDLDVVARREDPGGARAAWWWLLGGRERRRVSLLGSAETTDGGYQGLKTPRARRGRRRPGVGETSIWRIDSFPPVTRRPVGFVEKGQGSLPSNRGIPNPLSLPPFLRYELLPHAQGYEPPGLELIS